MKANNQAKPALADRLGRVARERAENEARHIPWQRLLEARNQYIDWHEFYFWVRSIVESEDRIPEWLAEILNERCPGFIASEKECPHAAQDKPLPLRFEDWIDNHVFGFTKQEGWFNAISFYAVREPRYQRAEVFWSESVKQWGVAKPSQYPSFDEWKDRAAMCDDTAHLLPEVRKARASARLVARERLTDAVSRYIEWEAFACWVSPALERTTLPAAVTRELGTRCPGFLEVRSVQDSDCRGETREWDQLMGWVVEHYFEEANAEGWLDAILVQAQSHPRAIRTMEYADHCEELWASQWPEPYPSFAQWRKDADSYIEAPAG